MVSRLGATCLGPIHELPVSFAFSYPFPIDLPALVSKMYVYLRHSDTYSRLLPRRLAEKRLIYYTKKKSRFQSTTCLLSQIDAVKIVNVLNCAK